MKIYNSIELFQSSELPLNGWIQACLICQSKTARLFDYKIFITLKPFTFDYKIFENKTSIYDFKAHLCPDCGKQLQNKTFEEKLFKKCDRQIKKNYPQLLFGKLTTNELYLPVDPKPPEPREVSSSSSTIST